MTTQSSPGKSYRKGMSLVDAVKQFSDEADAEAWFIEQRWPNGVACPHCGDTNIATVKSRKPQPFRCRGCRKHFSVKTGTLLHSSKLPLSQWAIAFYLYNTNLKGVSSMKLHRDLGISQSASWYMAYRIRGMWNAQADKFAGRVEVDETWVGGKEHNKHESKKLNAGRGPVGKTPVIGMKDLDTGQVTPTLVEHTDKPTLQAFVESGIEDGAKVYTDEHPGYRDLQNHETVKHSVKEYVHGQAHTTDVGSFWAGLKRGYVGTYREMSAKHLHRYVNEFVGRHNDRPFDTREQMRRMVQGAHGKRMRYADLIA